MAGDHWLAASGWRPMAGGECLTACDWWPVLGCEWLAANGWLLFVLRGLTMLYSLRGLNPRPMAHKTIALATELRELHTKANGVLSLTKNNPAQPSPHIGIKIRNFPAGRQPLVSNHSQQTIRSQPLAAKHWPPATCRQTLAPSHWSPATGSQPKPPHPQITGRRGF